MVSLKKIFKRYKYFFLLASLFVLGSATKSFAWNIAVGWFCVVGETRCCVNGVKSCCEDNGTLYDTSSCDDSCGASGTKQYKYTADGGCSYSTSTRTCCSDGTWSPWDASCPTTKTCPTSSKPETRTTCTGGYKTRTVTCNTSTGEWTTGSWGDCDCSDSAYELVLLAGGGGTCCQRKDGTGMRCRTELEIGYGWVKMGTPCWNKIDCGTGTLPECNESMKGTYWSKWISDNTWNSGCGSQYSHINGSGYCQQYLCRQG